MVLKCKCIFRTWYWVRQNWFLLLKITCINFFGIRLVFFCLRFNGFVCSGKVVEMMSVLINWEVFFKGHVCLSGERLGRFLGECWGTFTLGLIRRSLRTQAFRVFRFIWEESHSWTEKPHRFLKISRKTSFCSQNLFKLINQADIVAFSNYFISQQGIQRNLDEKISFRKKWDLEAL